MLVANARLNGKKTCEQISEHLADLGVEAGTSTVYRDLEILEAEWREAAALSIAKIKEADLNKLSELEKLLELELHAGSTLDVDKYTELLLRIQDRRSKLLGLDAAKKMEIGGRDGGPIKVQSLKDSELEEIITAGRQTPEHYRNGREAKNGDKVVQLDHEGKIKQLGVLYDAVPGNDYCNGQIAPIQQDVTGACMVDCLTRRRCR
jgi:hypothetical protein